MAGASDDHNRIAGNIFGELRERLRGKRCEPFMVDMKAKVPPTIAGAYYYPDVLVACDPTDNAKYFRERPAVIFEVISPETERIDRRRHGRRSPSTQMRRISICSIVDVSIGAAIRPLPQNLLQHRIAVSAPSPL